MLRQALTFSVVGLVATLLQYAVLAIAVEWFHWPPAAASAFGFCLAAGVNYWLNYQHTFGSTARHGQAGARFALVAAAGLCLNTFVMVALVHWLRLHYLPAQVLATMATLGWNFTASRHWVFHTTEAPHAD